MYSLISPWATLIASDPSDTTTTRHPKRISNVSIIFAVIGLSSAKRHVRDLSLVSMFRLKSKDPDVDDGGVVSQ